METRRRRVAQNGSKAPSIHRRYRIPVSNPRVTRALDRAMKDRPQWQKVMDKAVRVKQPSRVWPWSTPTSLNKERALLGLPPKASQVSRLAKGAKTFLKAGRTVKGFSPMGMAMQMAQEDLDSRIYKDDRKPPKKSPPSPPRGPYRAGRKGQTTGKLRAGGRAEPKRFKKK